MLKLINIHTPNANHSTISDLIGKVPMGGKIRLTLTAINEETAEVYGTVGCFFTKLGDDAFLDHNDEDYIEDRVISRCHLFHLLLDAFNDAKHWGDEVFLIAAAN